MRLISQLLRSSFKFICDCKSEDRTKGSGVQKNRTGHPNCGGNGMYPVRMSD